MTHRDVAIIIVTFRSGREIGSCLDAALATLLPEFSRSRLTSWIKEGLVSRDEALAQADSPTNLLWRLQNEQAPVSRVAPTTAEPDSPSFTEITLDVVPETTPPASLVSARTR